MAINTASGKVYLVGAGPGDPGLITQKGVECLRRSDVIVYDYLASPSLLNHISTDAETIYVGKQGGDHTMSQEEINALIVEKAKAGRTVTRLKGGDPFIFGRGGEEVEALSAANIPFEVVPGVTSAIAAPAYAGIPLTHRKFTSTLAFVTGHEDPTRAESRIDWDALAKGIGTLVFLMGVKNLPNIVEKLMECGMPADRPVALIRWGTTPMQEAVVGTMGDIVRRVKEAGFAAPAIVVVGDVVGLRKTMNWFEKRPLLGKRIVITRAREQASDLVQRLSDLGAECIECPAIKIEPPRDIKPLERSMDKLALYDWIVFTSVNGVRYFFERLFKQDKDARALAHIRFASIGPATTERLFAFGIKSDIVPESYRAESLVEAFRKEDLKGKKILIPRAAEARPILPRALKKMGARVDEITAYQTQAVDKTGVLLPRLEKGTIDMITFTSSSTVKNFKALLPPEKFEALLQGVTIASIGPITEETAKQLGFDVHVVADTFTIPGLCDAILRHYQSARRSV